MSSLTQSMVRRYRLLPESLPAAEHLVRRQQLVPHLLILAAMFLASIFLGMRSDDNLVKIIPMVVIAALFLTYMFFVIPRRTRKILARCWNTYTLEIGPDYLLRQQADTPDLRIPFSDIIRIERRPGEYVRVVGTQKLHVIGIPSGIEHSEEVWQTLSALAPVSDSATNHFFRRHVVSALFCVGFLGMLWAPSPLIVLSLAVVLLIVLVWGIVERKQNPNATRAGKRAMWLYVWIMFLVTLKVVTTLAQVLKQ